MPLQEACQYNKNEMKYNNKPFFLSIVSLISFFFLFVQLPFYGMSVIDAKQWLFIYRERAPFLLFGFF